MGLAPHNETLIFVPAQALPFLSAFRRFPLFFSFLFSLPLSLNVREGQGEGAKGAIHKEINRHPVGFDCSFSPVPGQLAFPAAPYRGHSASGDGYHHVCGRHIHRYTQDPVEKEPL
jgi:hypothetical protein